MVVLLVLVVLAITVAFPVAAVVVAENRNSHCNFEFLKVGMSSS